MSGHTATPWSRNRLTEWSVVGDGDRLVANTTGHQSNVKPELVEEENRANADLILRAVNSHEDLLDTLRRIIDVVGFDNRDKTDRKIKKWARVAIEKAEGR